MKLVYRRSIYFDPLSDDERLKDGYSIISLCYNRDILNAGFTFGIQCSLTTVRRFGLRFILAQTN